MQIGTANADGRHMYLDFARAWVGNHAFGQMKLAHAGQFRGSCRDTHRLRKRSTSSASVGTQATALPPWMVLLPEKSKKRAPASSVIILSGARSHGFTCASIQTSASPRAIIMASRQPP